MQALFPFQAEKYPAPDLRRLLHLPDFQPPLDLRSGYYHTPPDIAQWPHQKVAGGMAAGLSMFWNYLKVVRRDRAVALRGAYSDFLWARSALELQRLFERYGAKFQIEGLDALQTLAQQAKPAVFAANHMSTLETQTLCGYITPYMRTTFVVKSLLARGYFGPLICSRPFIALERQNPLQDLEIVLKEGTEILHQGRSVILFPQGTREQEQFSCSRFNSIAVRLAARAGVAVVPVAISSSFWSSSQKKWNQYIPRLRPELPVHFSFGPPIPVSGRGKAQQQQLVDFISSKMELWGVPVLP